MSLIPFTLAILAISNETTKDCKDANQLRTWLGVECGLFIVNMAMATYVIVYFSKPYDTAVRSDRNFFSRAEHLVCNDGWAAIFILVTRLEGGAR